MPPLYTGSSVPPDGPCDPAPDASGAWSEIRENVLARFPPNTQIVASAATTNRASTTAYSTDATPVC